MSAQLPLWFGRERGVDLSSLVDWEDEGSSHEGSGVLDDVGAGMLGFTLPLAIIALAIALGQLPMWAMVLLGIGGAAWLMTGVRAAWIVAFSEEQPSWVRATVAIMVGLGKVLALAFIIASVVLVLVLIAMIIFGLASDRR